MGIDVKPFTANIEVVINNDMLADKISKLQNELAELEAEKKRLNSLVSELQGENAELQAQIIQVDNKINQLTEELNVLNGEVVNNPSEYALGTKSAIAEAITSKGGIITPETTFRTYADEINNLPIEKKGDKHTLLLLHFDESPTKDDSLYADINNVTAYNTPALNTSIKKFGKSSLDVVNNGHIFVKNYAFPYINGNVFTIEFWIYPTQLILYAVCGQAVSASNSSPKGWAIGTMPQGSAMQLRVNTAWSVGFPLSQIVAKQWQHIAICREGKTAYAFLNGVLMEQKECTSTTSTYSLDIPPAYFVIGGLYSSSNTFGFRGYIDEFRVSDVCRYKESFTPQTEPFTI